MTYGLRTWRDWVLDEAASRPFIERALAAGINFFDTADTYSRGESERILGRALKDMVADREDVVIATKCFGGTHDFKTNRWGLSRKNIIASCDASLKRLGTDYIDLYQIHRFDSATPMEETLDALDSLVACGKVCATSAPPRCTPGSSSVTCTSRSATARRASSPCRTTTTCSTARRSAR